MKFLLSLLIIFISLIFSGPVYAAGPVNLSFNPPSANLGTVGSTFTTDVIINTGGDSVSAVSFFVNYDPTVVQATQIQPDPAFPVLLKGQNISGNTATIDLGTNINKPFIGTGKLVTISFQILKNSASSQISIDSTKTLVSAINKTDNDLGTTTSLQLNKAVTGSTIKIYAAGTPVNNVYPTMKLSISGKVVKTFYDVRGNPNNRNFLTLSYSDPNTISSSSVRLSFTNDAYKPKINQDRNLVIDKININGVDYQAEDVSVYAQGGKGLNGCANGFLKTEWLLCNGYFQFK